MHASPSANLRAAPPPAHAPPIRDHDPSSTVADQPETWLVCVQCATRITQPGLARHVHGRFAHTLTNPHGLTFELGCYHGAPGARAHGPAYAADSWFQGYAWRVAACRGCVCHLGWRFSAGDAAFWGLIRDALVEEQ